MEILLKQQLHQLIDNCNDDDVLLQAKQIIESETKLDWWNELTAKQQAEITQLLNEPDEKNTVLHSEFLNATQRWSTK